MSYEVIARKWRPQAFDDVSGQEHVTTALRNAIRSDRMPHAVLLTGPRGVGKTTLARLVARCLNCEKGPTDEPCGSCDACQEITAGRSSDVQEVDAASRTSVDDVRELIESIRYAPSPGKYRIFVVDEVHMLSTAAFNALLKTLEEPPPRSLFVFATTNPEKIPYTVVSRCQRYDLRRISSAEVVARLRTIADSEGVAISDASLLALAREGEGSMRDSQTLLDQVIAFGGGGEVSDESVAEILDLIDRRVLLGILGACVDSDAAAALRSCADAASKGADPGRLARDLVGLLRDLVVLSVADDDALVEGSEDEIAELRALAQRGEPARLRRMFRALIQEQEDLAWAPQPMAVLEMALLRLATMPAGDDVARLLARIDALEQQLRGGGGPGGAGPAGGGPTAGRGGAAPRRTAAAETATTAAAATETAGPTSPQASRTAAGSPGRGPETAAEPGTDPEPASTPASASTVTSPATSPTTSPATSPATAATASAPASRPEPTSSSRPEPAPPPASAMNAESQPEPTPRPSPTATPDAAPESLAAASPSAAAPSTAPPQDAPLAIVYDRLRSFAQEANRGLFASLDGGRLVSREPGQLQIEVPGSFHCKRLHDRLDELERICGQFFGAPTRVDVQQRGAGPTPSMPAASPAPRREEDRRRKQEALNHPAINIALEELRGEIVEINPLRGRAGASPPATPEGGTP